MPSAPEYSEGAAPPSYDEVIKKFSSTLGDSKDPQKFLQAVGTLNTTDLKVVAAEHSDNSLPTYNEEDRAKFDLGVAKTASTAEAQQHLKEAANKATEAVKEIKVVFQDLIFKITEIDNIHQSTFMPELETHQKSFNTLVSDSRLLATDISQYGKEFDDVIVKFCADESIKVEDRITQIQRFIQQASDFETRSSKMEERFQDLITDFTKFIAGFASWATKKEGEMDGKVTGLIKEIGELKMKLAKVQASLIGVGAGGTTVGGFLLAGGLAVPGPWSIVLIAGGIFLLGASLATAIGLIAEMSVLSNEISAKEKEQADYEKQIEIIQQARAKLVELGDDKLKVFTEKMNFLAGYWTRTTADAREVEKWLKSGAKFAV
ncbi:uncharacterized protein N7487_011670 [Penicillium crustosum]|uniref:uncharacterized protein n=1 Tax=Penicillium crustosum TaxID=36656 RepID=UPI002388F433|nr:uncharacterized protein N7487_011670 [Penicillium crustosum]KAJ5394029.1 hypothetical protein N7487_011670 [Penicillium crustosum]